MLAYHGCIDGGLLMKTITFVEIENIEIIENIENASPDPEETNKMVDAIIAKNPDILCSKTREELLAENIVFARLGKGQKNVDDAEGTKLRSILDSLEPHKKLCLSGDTIADWRGTEYWMKRAGNWKKEKVEHLEETIPAGAILPEDLLQTQQKEIADQAEAERVANLAPDKKTEEKEAALAAALREVRILKEEAEIAGNPFDASAEYKLRKKGIEEKYG
jgi:hypothetical protein